MPAAANLGPCRQACAGWWAWLVTAALCGPAVLCCAVQAVKTFIRSPDIFQCDFWELPAVQQLAQDKSSAPLLQLLDVVLQGDLQGEQQGPSCAACWADSSRTIWSGDSTYCCMEGLCGRRWECVGSWGSKCLGSDDHTLCLILR